MEAETGKIEQLSKDYKDVFASEQGKRVLEDLDKQCRRKLNPFNPNNSHITDYNCGVLWVNQYIHRRIDMNLMETIETEVINQGVNL